MKKAYIGVDVGGMSIKAGVVSTNGKILLKERVKTSSKSSEVFLKDLKKLIEKVLKEAKENGIEVLGIGFGVPGIVDKDKGIIEKMANIQGRNIKVKEYLSFLNLPIKMSNDANVACLAEQKFGAAKGIKDVVMLTLGTGIGGGVIIDGKLYEGREGKGTELGHITLVKDGVKCGCGRRGCFEAYASATALIRITKNHMKRHKESLMWEFSANKLENVGGHTCFECAKKGDEEAIKVVDEYIANLGEGMLSLCNIFRPEVFVIGGGVSAQKSYLIDKLDKYLEDREYGYAGSPKSDVVVASLGNDAGIIGAASLFLE